MEKREKPSVMITTYISSPSKSSYVNLHNNNNNNNNKQISELTQNDQDELTRSIAEQSTDLFRKKHHNKFKSSKVLHELNQIKGPNGSIRGHKDVVKKSLENIKVVELISQRTFSVNASIKTATTTTTTTSPNDLVNQQQNSLTSNNSSNGSRVSQQLDELYKLDFLQRLHENEQDQCVVYTTTLGIIRRTFEDSKSIKSILNLNLIKYEERDIYLNQEYKYELRMRCKSKSSVSVPVLFVDGLEFGGIKEIEELNESGQLVFELAKFKMSEAPKNICMCCGNARFIACQSCNGSRKSTIHHFKFNSIALRCIKCDKNDGLVQCPVCCPQITGFGRASNALVDCNNNNTNIINNNNNNML